MSKNSIYPSIEGKLHKIVSPKTFLKTLRENREAIKRTKFIVPKLGSKSLGKFYVEYYYAPTSKKSASI
jgi:predicted metalloendopeptidase